ncbi:hypothetical protein SH1V18_24430 [Vallitalea longa]|uniref:N-acetyltransferase domain-containing protein n=1 Tax=Vallitalea longa TaxID=2936439 RepID=A0A9W5YCQ4_9FIRM|nr:GNAT family N-acetyltransferase [Vallitalea longa]GKX29963.1 hypothetical protein SH1V18_24430 [Vallitalea longa]
MDEIKIVKYNHSYAEKVADMWNKSGANWGGEQTVTTAEGVINDNEKMGNICAFLALDGDEVVGYCSFSQYRHDEGASYIPLLNVRTDHIGKKIGKTLVKECVKMAMDAKWPRLDLYTWQGNDKAVPVYKKCGFFWENRDGSTHLMNFLPYVMRTEAVKDYFNTMDWYDDNVREIKIESDGRIEGDFEYYEYMWQKEDVTLKMEFERNGRGLTCIETNDYIIRARVNKKELVIGKNYEVKYELVNKTGKELDIRIKGTTDKNITNNTEYTGSIKNKEIISGGFFVDTIDEEQDKYRSHPCVAAIITINGKDALFRVGIYPNNPIKMAIANKEEQKYLNKSNVCYINIENNFDEDVSISFSLKDKKWVSFNDDIVKCSLQAKEKQSISVPCKLSDYGFYDEEIEVKIYTPRDEIKHIVNVRGPFRGATGKYHGEDEEYYGIYNGHYSIKLMKKDNSIDFTKLGSKDDDGIFLQSPQIGKPYTIELSNKKADGVLLDSTEEAEIIKATYELEKFKDIMLDYYIELYANGVVKVYAEIKNLSDSYTYDELYYTSTIYYLLNDALMPINNNIVRTPNYDGVLTKQWDANKLSENWIFNNSNKFGIGWYEGTEISFNEIFVVTDSKIENLLPGKSYIIEPIILTIDTFNSWYDFRKYMGNDDINNNNIKQSFECVINGGNPFLDDDIEVTFEEAKMVPVDGSVTISSKNNLFDPVSKRLDFEGNKASVDCLCKNKAEMDILKMKVDMGKKNVNRERAIFFKDNKEVVLKQYIEQDKEVYEADNGIIKIKSSPEFAQGIFSLKHKDEEWLDSSFPEACVKSWWNFWTGGYLYKYDKLNYASLYKEKNKAEFVTLEDNFKNHWSGIKSSVDIKENAEYKGVSIDQYFLLLSGVPVLCDFAVIHQNSKKYLEDHPFNRVAFIKHTDDIKNNFVIVEDRREEIIYKCGETEFDIFTDKYLNHGSIMSDYRLIHMLNTNGSAIVFGNTNGTSFETIIEYISSDNATSILSRPAFMIFSKDDLNDVVLENLYKISFDIL